MTFIEFIIIFYLAMSITSPFITLFHELGHALTYLVLTKPNNVNIYIGSYGDKKNNFKIKVGKLNIFFKYSFPLVKSIGLCKIEKTENNPIKFILILLAGPVFSFLIAVIAGYFVFRYDVNDYLRVFCGILIMFSGLSLLTNLFSFQSSRMSLLDYGSDGKQIVFTFKYRKVYQQYVSMLEDLHNNDLKSASEKLERLIHCRHPHEYLLRLQLGCLNHLKKYNKALEVASDLEKMAHLTVNDNLNYGYALSMQKRHIEANKYYLNVLKSYPKNLLALYNTGYSYIELCDYDKAEKFLNKAINLNPEWFHPNNTLGYLKIKQQKFDEAKILLTKAQELNPNEPDNYKNWGLYYLKLGDFEMARCYFDKCIEIDSSVDLEEYLNELEYLKRLL